MGFIHFPTRFSQKNWIFYSINIGGAAYAAFSNHKTHPLSLTRRFFLRATGNASDHCILGLSPSGGPMRWDGNITTTLRFTSRIIAYATHARIIQSLNNFFTRWGLLFPPNRSVTPKDWGRSAKWNRSIIFKMRTDSLASFADPYLSGDLARAKSPPIFFI